MRFHKFKHHLNNDEVKILYNTLTNELKNNGIERRRTGGSSGIIQYSSTLKMLMHTPGSTPRKSMGCAWMRMNNNSFNIYYINTKIGEPKVVTYTNPVMVGNFKLPSILIGKYHFLKEFIMTKPICALIIEKISPTLKKMNLPYKINEIAIRTELLNIKNIRNLAFDLKYDAEINFFKLYSNHWIQYTMFKHAVGNHQDTFADGLPSLENKICFKFLNNGNKCLGEGRGGGGKNYHCWALLDWGSENRDRRNIWLDKNNLELRKNARFQRKPNCK